MKIIWKNKKRSQLPPSPNLTFAATGGGSEPPQNRRKRCRLEGDCGTISELSHTDELAESFQSQGNSFAEEGKYREALGKWEAALTLAPGKAVLHEQKAQVLLEIGDAWTALKAATRATELEPSWAEAWITLARAQLNFGEPDASIISFDRAFAIKPDSKDAKADRETALKLVKKREQLNSSHTICATSEGRFTVGDKL